VACAGSHSSHIQNGKRERRRNAGTGGMDRMLHQNDGSDPTLISDPAEAGDMAGHTLAVGEFGGDAAVAGARPQGSGGIGPIRLDTNSSK
jgi:hypothetical protein